MSEQIEQFWAEARVRGALNPIRGVSGPSVLESVMPPAWAFGADPETATRLLDRVLQGVKTATASLFSEYEAEGVELPAVGQLSIILDGESHPRALIRVTHVRTIPFREVEEGHALAEGEDSLEDWRAAHRAFFASRLPEGATFDEASPVVLERFEVLVPPEARRKAAKRRR
nr:ASCH domain-containing protein [Actinomycetales bacterium]